MSDASGQTRILNNLSQLSTVLKLAYHLWTLEINIIPLRFAPPSGNDV
jgi:hypothetical protein